MTAEDHVQNEIIRRSWKATQYNLDDYDLEKVVIRLPRKYKNEFTLTNHRSEFIQPVDRLSAYYRYLDAGTVTRGKMREFVHNSRSERRIIRRPRDVCVGGFETYGPTRIAPPGPRPRPMGRVGPPPPSYRYDDFEQYLPGLDRYRKFNKLRVQRQ